MADTEFDAQAVRDSAKVLGGIMSDMGAFDELKAQWPNAGSFDTAQWLERIVDDRRNGIVAHAERLKIILNDLNTGLTQIANDLEDTDQDNAAQINKRMDSIGATIDSDVAALDKGTEGEQHNFSGGPEEGNEADGDGYNDVLPA
ncbi:MAG: hypothetical protein ABW212_17420 [Pseudonocardia sediminis]